MKRIFEKLLILISCVALTACNINEEFFAPKIILDNETGIYTVKYGREIVVKPSYEHAEKATYCWTMEGEVLGISPSLSFSQQEVGEYFITLKVTTEYGSDEEEIRIDVVELEIPTVSIAGNKKVTVTVGAEVLLNATVRETFLPAKFAWTVNDVIVSNEHNYTFVAKEIGNYIVKATAKNDDGSHSDMVEVEVLNADDIPFTWEFEKYAYHTVVGRKLVIKPLPSYEHNVDYSWNVEEIDELTGSDSYFVFLADEAGSYHINAVATTSDDDNQISMTRTFVVTVYGEKDFYRPKNGASQADWNKVFEYTPAPGQFINELKTGGFDAYHTNPEAAITYAEGRLSEGKWISLGGFGGYLVVGFDHSIDNNRSYNLGVVGNAFDGSSEPGIVWVMQDENGNGYPDDTWYELAGSETGKFETYRDYAVTYYRPSGIGMPVQWTDNYGNSGEIDYLAQYHNQDYYYPLWIGMDSYTLTGTRLEARNYDQSGNGSYWIQPHYDWGYADNFSPSDFNSENKANLFRISNAIDFEGNPINLSHIDFVKVQCAVNSKSGWLGELSTEVCGFYDYSLKR
ncbi:MAG: PKD domain-containing protein [Lentimicrobiaceae bacterium]|nr:PKD domain-containing protein [Lentimicrobiaceae bacterium]